MILPRRKVLLGLASLLAAPAIVRVSSLMPIKSYESFDLVAIDNALRDMWAQYRILPNVIMLDSELYWQSIAIPYYFAVGGTLPYPELA